MDAVVHVPHGAYPTACYGQYDYDPVFLKHYANLAKDETAYRAYLDSHIRVTASHAEFLQKAAGDRLETLKADPSTGYARNLDRR